MPRVGARVVVAPGASVASPPTRRSPDTAPFPHSSLHGARRRWLCRRPADPPSSAHVSSSHGARRTPACSSTLLAFWHSMTPVCLVCPGLRTHSSDIGRKPRARRVRQNPPRVRGDRGQRHGRKPRACPLPSTCCHGSASMYSDFVRVLPSVFRPPDPQLCMGRHTRATSRSPSVSSNEAQIRRCEPRRSEASARFPAT